MKAILLAFTLLLAGCSDTLVTEHGVYPPYGLVNKTEIRNECVLYHVSGLSIVAIIVFSESILIPGYIVGWDLYEPLSVNAACLEKG